MYIQEVVIDGFKSYAQRTVIEGFDPHFNAITGLNGSGKSNILDAICFVLGITNLSQVRAGSLSELVYKQGQAGVTKATVTVLFNNEDTANSPVGYENCPQVTVTRQVLLGGKSKYLVNGRTSPAAQVQNLFHSVQLNVNNPHFLIMQGRITKVLNMKPPEILGMVEEAAGTRLYETKKVAALKTIDKKQLKVDELNRVLSEEITPTLEKLRGEKQSYLEWSKNHADLERLERYCVASEYWQATRALDAHGTTAMEAKVDGMQEELNGLEEQLESKQEEIGAQTKLLQGEFEDEYNQSKATEEKLSKELVQITSTWTHAKDTVNKADEDLQSARSMAQETQAAVTHHETAMQEKGASIEACQEAAAAAEARVQELSTEYQNMCAGISNGTLPEQISQAHSDSKTAEAKVEQAEMKMAHLEKELATAEKGIQKQGKQAEKMAKQREAANAKVQKVQAQVDELGFSEDEYNQLDQEKHDLKSAVTELEETIDTLEAKLNGRLGFRYSDPVRGFDRSKVKGLIAKLITVKDSQYSTALEVTAGGKLYQVVVDEAVTGKALLERGKLERRVTIIPLDKIRSRQLSTSVCKRAGEISASLDSTASPAIELVGFDEEVRCAVEYVFGSTIIVDGMKAANMICDQTKTRTVTLEGDVYDPTGTISGGSNNDLGTTLVKLTELAQAVQELEVKQTKLAAVSKKHASLKSAFAKFEQLNGKLQLAQAELETVEKHLGQTSFGMLVERRDTMLAELEEAKDQVVAMEKEQKEKWDLYNELKERESELTQQREDTLAGIEQAVKDAKADFAEKSKLAREASSRSQTLSLELDSLKAEAEAAVEAVGAAQKALDEAMQQEADIQMKVGQLQATYESAKMELDKLDARMTECSALLVGLKNQKADLTKSIENVTLEMKKLTVAMDRIRKERAGAEKIVAAMEKKYVWIESEKSAFGVSGGDYDFESTDPAAAKEQYETLKTQQESLGKKINKKVMGMIEKAEGEYTELLRKRKVVENDKKKIQKVIEELDIKKKSELQMTWQKVNRDFGSIFSTLLPGASSKLEPPEGMEAWEGLEVKVAFGNVWKDSLSELSGGQRSLLALSLILSLLLFKPAPMYILDEVDAALDLSHTQNIGNMLKTHFSQSQFLVVSLKEGMFNNANVIFRTKFVDGVSTVTRTIGTGSSRANRGDEKSRGGARSRGKENALGM